MFNVDCHSFMYSTNNLLEQSFLLQFHVIKKYIFSHFVVVVVAVDFSTKIHPIFVEKCEVSHS